jgi:hypothetical protein
VSVGVPQFTSYVEPVPVPMLCPIFPAFVTTTPKLALLRLRSNLLTA